jgi:MerR family mercuric resistance operon transcriptional regulator
MGRAVADSARSPQQPQFRQVQGLQRQPPVLQVQAGWAFSVLVIVFSFDLPCGESAFSFRTVVRSQAMNVASPKNSAMTITRLGAAAGVGVETVRYYQRRGLLAVPASTGAVRRYGAEDVRRLRFIRRAQAAGFTLEEIGELLALDRTQNRARVRELAAERISALDARIAELEASRATLERLRATCASGKRGPCPILEAFDGA